VAWVRPDKFRVRVVKRILEPKHINEPTKLILALLWAGLTPNEIKDYLGLDQQSGVIGFAGQLLRSDNRVIKNCLKHGLPAQCSVTLPSGFEYLCRCGITTSLLPCVACSALQYSEGRKPDGNPLDYLVDRAKPFGEPTEARPGSWEKVEVMRKRLENDLSIFHPGDAIIINWT
jgi:hypothetical protein